MAALRSLAAEKSRRFREGFVGRSLPAITLHTPPALAAQGRSSALSDNYLPLELTETLPANQLVEVRIAGIHADGSLLAALDVESALPLAQIELRATVFVTTK
jgi:hypothetical protein